MLFLYFFVLDCERFLVFILVLIVGLFLDEVFCALFCDMLQSAVDSNITDGSFAVLSSAYLLKRLEK